MSLDKLIEQKIDALLTQKLAVVDQALDRALGKFLGSPETSSPTKPAKPRATSSKATGARKAAKVTPEAVTKALGGSESLSMEALAKAIGSTPRALRPVVQKLVADGALAKSGKLRGTRYALAARPQ